jgi:hypothetical protein
MIPPELHAHMNVPQNKQPITTHIVIFRCLILAVSELHTIDDMSRQIREQKIVLNQIWGRLQEGALQRLRSHTLHHRC